MLKLYAATYWAAGSDNVHIKVGFVYSSAGKEAALGYALQKAREHYPSSEGYSSQSADVLEIPDYIVVGVFRDIDESKHKELYDKFWEKENEE